MISDNSNVNFGIFDCSLHTPCIALKDDYHKKRKELLEFRLVVFYYLEIPAKTFIIPARQNQFIQENTFNKAQVRRILVAMITNSAFWYQKFDLRQVRILRGGQPIVTFDTTDDCSLYATKKIATNFQDDIPSVPMEDFKDHYLV